MASGSRGGKLEKHVGVSGFPTDGGDGTHANHDRNATKNPSHLRLKQGQHIFFLRNRLCRVNVREVEVDGLLGAQVEDGEGVALAVQVVDDWPEQTHVSYPCQELASQVSRSRTWEEKGRISYLQLGVPSGDGAHLLVPTATPTGMEARHR